ncbi:SurA N-terminal domain-containing protein [Sphingosinicella humi]|uniref:Peptidyl-prolyl cis-trans isomerase, EpsD family n=1 Tax=Allosphingosinicella humi TaxID=2068657 RepID=A0A2U2J528_9SPHN|nr:SurA N-terminal domain-containing protein [Sphingosinicella humi]PWG03453.1 hypothetical protein DF286_11660 [Sphingosinicella humi]
MQVRFRRIAITTLLFSAIGCSNADPEGQVVAVVNGTEITQSELDEELRVRNLPSTSNAPERAAVLDELIDRELLAQEARRRDLDRTPAYLLALNRFEREKLAELLAQSMASSQEAPSPDQVAAFIRDNPGSFQNRVLLSVDQILFQRPADPAVLQKLGAASTLDEIDAILERARVRKVRQVVAWDSAALSKPLLERIRRVPQGEPFVIPQSDPLIAARVIATIPAALPEGSGRDLASQRILQDNAIETLELRLRGLRRAAEIEYQEGFAPAAK